MSDLVALKGQRIRTDLLYLKSCNLFERPLYDELGITQALIHKDAVPLLEKLDQALLEKDLYLVVYDAYRPIAAQQAMWAILPDERYVAPPSRGSKHNRGTALDCYLLDAQQQPLEFPTSPDGYYQGCAHDIPKWLEYLERAHHSFQDTECASACRNRDLLHALMTQAGFVALEEEWWHYELPNAASYPLIEDELATL